LQPRKRTEKVVITPTLGDRCPEKEAGAWFWPAGSFGSRARSEIRSRPEEAGKPASWSPFR
jgi:hypothetical protein